MRLFEYQGKILFKEMGIKIPEGRLIDSDLLATEKEINFPAIAKVQSLAPGRGLYGGVQRCENRQDLIDFAKKYLNQTFRGEPVKKILVEDLVSINKEFYFALRINSLRLCIDLIYSAGGGNGIEERTKDNPKAIQVIHIDPLKSFFIFDANNLAKELGFDGVLMNEVADLIYKMFTLFNKYDAKLIEINPVVLTADNQIFALDAIIQLDDDANFRQSLDSQIGLITEERPREATPREQQALSIDQEDYRGAVHYIDLDDHGDIGLLSVGSGFSITVMDILRNFGIKPANFCDCSGNPSKEKVYKAAKLIMEIPGIKAFLFISGMVSQPLDVSAEGIVMAFKEVNPSIPVFVRIAGNQEVEAINYLKLNGITETFSRLSSVEDVIGRVKASI